MILNQWRRKWWFLPALALIYVALFFARPLWFHTWCAQTPTPCTPDSVNAFDRIAFQFGSIQADFLSNLVQNGIGVLVFLMPWALYGVEQFKKAWQEDALLIEIALWNTVLMEVARAVVQRPRPLVYQSPMVEGLNIHHYTSFYSGHTSFVALATLHLFFVVKRRYPEAQSLRLNFGLVYFAASLLTGCLRVFGGRHFPTDVIAAFLIGSLLSWAVNRSFTQSDRA